MKLIVNEFGSYVSKRENRFVIKSKEKEEEYSADQIEQIIISSPSSISEGVVRLAMEKILILFTLLIMASRLPVFILVRWAGRLLQGENRQKHILMQEA